MLFKEYLETINSLKGYLGKGVLPVIDHQVFVKDFVSPIIEAQNQLLKQTTMEMYKSIYAPLNDYLAYINSDLRKSVLDVIKTQQSLIKNLNFSVPLPILEIDSQDMSDLCIDLMNQIEEIDTPDELDYSKQVVKEAAKNNGPKSLTDFINLVASITSIIVLLLSCMPNTHEERIIDALNQLVEIQAKQLNMLEERLDKHLNSSVETDETYIFTETQDEVE